MEIKKMPDAARARPIREKGGADSRWRDSCAQASAKYGQNHRRQDAINPSA
jgi:hypothetical protein